MADLSRKEIARLRGLADWSDRTAHRFCEVYTDTLRTLLDSHEALRPRPASEKPAARCAVLLRSTFTPEWTPGEYKPQCNASVESYFWYSESDGMLLDRHVIEWIPYPEHGDG